jgi:predicted aspartyl protease
MSMVIGSLEDGTPALKISVGGVFGQPKEVTVIVDTGFSGFLSMPLIQAFPLGLPLYGTADVVLADGSTQAKLQAMAKVTFDGVAQTGLVILEPDSNEILIGMDFLRRFKRGLFLTSAGLVMVDEDELSKYLPQQGPRPEGEPGDNEPTAKP